MSNIAAKNQFQDFYHRLSGKFIIASVLVGVILILSSVTSQFYINQSSSDATLVFESRLNKLNETRIIMDNVWDVSFFLEEHSIAPSAKTRQLIFEKLQTSVAKLSFLIQLEKGNKNAINSLQMISNDLSALGNEITYLLEIRGQPAKLYPAIQISRSSMFDNQNIFSNLIALSIDEVVNSLDETDPDALILLTELRYKWSQMISFYRMYLVNRLALLDENELVTQSANIELFFNSINRIFKLLEKLEKEDRLGFQAGDSIPKLKEAANAWVGDFRIIVSTKAPEKWRSDYPVIKTKIAPLMKSIWKSVHDYDENIEADVKKSVLDLSNVAKSINYTLMFFAATGLMLLIMLYYFIHNTLIKPIEIISEAMRSEAHDGRYLKPLLIKGKSKEAEDLIDAFSTMQLQVHRRKSELEYQALHDSLTDLPNRMLLFDRIRQTISQARRNHNSLALIMIDLDRFKEINDTLGHQAGDVLLQMISARLIGCLRQVDTVARLGGDEFAVLIPGCDEQQAKNIALKIRDCMQSAVQVNEQSLYISGSLGIAIYPQHGEDSDTLLKNADIGMYVSKRNGSAFEIYCHEQNQHSIDRLELKYMLKKAIDNDELKLFFQPQINCKTKKMIGVEALLRWNDSDGKAIVPDVFIPLAEESGLISSVTEWVFVAAIKQQKEWDKEGLDVHLSINLSAKNLLDSDFDDFVFEQSKKHALKTGVISFEITESAMMEDTDRALAMMRSLNSAGFNLIVDDYGTGFSSLAYLKRFPISDLKIDKSFVINMMDSDEDAMIVKSTIDLAHNLGLKVIAEGVETEGVLEMLNALHCDVAQGYSIGKPMSAAEFKCWYSLNQVETLPV